MCIYTSESLGGKARPERMNSEINLDTTSASSHSISTQAPLLSQNNSSCVTDCIRAAISLLIKTNPSDNIITEHQNLPIRTQDWKLPHGKAECRIVFIHGNSAPAWCSRGGGEQTWQCIFKGICHEKTIFKSFQTLLEGQKKLWKNETKLFYTKK